MYNMMLENVERVADTDEAKKKLEAKGFKVIGAKGKQPAAAPKTSTDLSQMNKKELLAIATEKGIEGVSALSKDELVEALKDVI